VCDRLWRTEDIVLAQLNAIADNLANMEVGLGIDKNHDLYTFVIFSMISIPLNHPCRSDHGRFHPTERPDFSKETRNHGNRDRDSRVPRP
jgi:hypothetical protein